MPTPRNKKRFETWWRSGERRLCWWTGYPGGCSPQASSCSTLSTGPCLVTTTSGDSAHWATLMAYLMILECTVGFLTWWTWSSSLLPHSVSQAISWDAADTWLQGVMNLKWWIKRPCIPIVHSLTMGQCWILNRLQYNNRKLSSEY